MKKILALVACLSIVASLAAGGSIAYLTDTESAKNTMTMGKVEIEQIEQERNENGALVGFTQSKPLYPAVFEGNSIPWAAESEWVEEGEQAWKVVEDNDNVVDKFVTVKNTGKSEAYVRTIIAYEGDATYGPEGAYIHVVHNSSNVTPAITVDCINTVEISGVKYTVYTYTYPEALAAGATSIPSLKQIYMNKAADNDVVEKYGDTYDILVLSQAVQTAGFTSAAEALNAAFGEVNATNAAEWFGGVLEEHGPDKWDGTTDTSWFDATQSEFMLTSAEQLAGVAALGNQLGGKTIKLNKDLDLGGTDWAPIRIFSPETPFTFDGQGNTIYNLTINSGADKGLFDNSTGTIKNLNIDGADIKTSGRSGALASRHYGNIENCHVKNSVIEDSYWATGGIVGLFNSGSINNCSITNVTVKSNGGTGGIVGVLNETGGIRKIENCQVVNSTIHNTGIYGASYSGAGIVGMINADAEVSLDGCTVDNATKLEGSHIYEICPPVTAAVTVQAEP